MATDTGAAVLGRFSFFGTKVHARKRLRAEGQKRFADTEARKFLALEHDDGSPGAGQQGRRSTAGGAPPIIATSYIWVVMLCSP
jgi:hypothetical protein